MQKQYASVGEMLGDLPLDDSLHEEVDARIKSRQMIKHLIALRVSHDLSQKDIADRLGCSQSRISKLENGVDDGLRVGDVRDYLHAMGLDLSWLVANGATTASSPGTG